MVYCMLYINIYTFMLLMYIVWFQGQGRMTYAGTLQSAIEHHYKGKHVLDIHLLKAERH